jgi:hypothetical protein
MWTSDWSRYARSARTLVRRLPGMVPTVVMRSLSPRGRWLTIALALGLTPLGACSHTVRVRHEVPLDAADSRACAARCLEIHAIADARAACLSECPNARELEEASCARVDRKSVACAVEKREEAGISPLVAIFGSVVVTYVLALFTIFVE